MDDLRLGGVQLKVEVQVLFLGEASHLDFDIRFVGGNLSLDLNFLDLLDGRIGRLLDRGHGVGFLGDLLQELSLRQGGEHHGGSRHHGARGVPQNHAVRAGVLLGGDGEGAAGGHGLPDLLAGLVHGLGLPGHAHQRGVAGDLRLVGQGIARVHITGVLQHGRDTAGEGFGLFHRFGFFFHSGSFFHNRGFLRGGGLFDNRSLLHNGDLLNHRFDDFLDRQDLLFLGQSRREHHGAQQKTQGEQHGECFLHDYVTPLLESDYWQGKPSCNDYSNHPAIVKATAAENGRTLVN